MGRGLLYVLDANRARRLYVRRQLARCIYVPSMLHVRAPPTCISEPSANSLHRVPAPSIASSLSPSSHSHAAYPAAPTLASSARGPGLDDPRAFELAHRRVRRRRRTADTRSYRRSVFTWSCRQAPTRLIVIAESQSEVSHPGAVAQLVLFRGMCHS